MPTTTGLATSFINFSRPGASGGGATVTDRDGKIKWAGHNLLTNSESFSASSWTLLQGNSTLPTVVANAAAAPNGTITADRINFGAIASGAAYSQIEQKFTSDTALYTFGFWIKAVAAGDVGKKVWFDLQTSASPAAFKAITITADWQFVSTIGGLTSGANRSATFYTQGPDYGGELQGAVSVYVWGAHLYRSDLGGMQQNPSMPAGMGSYYPTTPRNLLGYTEDFSNAAWSKGSATVSANAITAPNGLLTADLFKPSTSSEYQGATQSSTFRANTPYVLSFYAKAGGYNWVRGRFFFGALSCDQLFDVSSGVKGTTTNNNTGNTLTSTITSAGNGWFLISMSITAPSNAGSGNVSINIHSGDNGNQLTGDGTSGIYLWGAQLSDSASLDTYTPVYGAAVTSAAYYAPRLDFDGATLSPKGLLVEEQRTNLVPYSADFTQWTAQSGVTVTANQAEAPDGTTSADLIVGNGTTGVISSGIAVSAASNNTKSVWLRAVTGTATVLLKDGQQTGSTVTCNLTTSWQRFTLTETQSSGASSIWIDDVPAAGIYAWGGQIEQGSFATSYIPTGASTATRIGDFASVFTQAFPYSATEGTVVANFSSYDTDTVAVAWQIDDGGYTNRLVFNAANGGTSVVIGNSVTSTVDTSNPARNVVNKHAFAYKAANFAASLNGAAAATLGSGALPSAQLTSFRFGNDSATTALLNGWLRQITYIPRRLSNAELQSRSA